MKTIFLLLTSVVMAISTHAQEDTVLIKEDTTRVLLGKTKLLIIKANDSLELKTEKNDVPEDDDFTWTGIDIGINGFLSPANSINLPGESDFLEVDPLGSWHIGLNLWGKAIPLVKEYVDISTGVGFQFNKFSLKHGTRIAATNDTVLSFMDTTRSYDKNLLKAAYFQVPLILGFHTSKNPDDAFHFGVGVIGGLKLGSKMKYKFESEGETVKTKEKTDFNLNPFQLLATARVGYGNFSFFANYSLLPFFDDDKGPEVYPISVGVSFLGF